MSTPKPNPDQADVLAQCEQLTADLAAANQTIATLQAKASAVAAEKAQLESRLAQTNNGAPTAQAGLAAHSQALEALKAEVAALKQQTEDFNGRLAAELSKHGVRPEAVAQKPNPDRKLTATERCQAAKGTK